MRNRSLLKRAARLTSLSGDRYRQKVIRDFARKFHFVYFASSISGLERADAIRGSTSAHGQTDRHICIGSHDGYDAVLLERHVTFESTAAPTASHEWLILQIDLHTTYPFPFVFLGTKQQSKAFYARLFTTRREVRLLDSEHYVQTKRFDSQFTLVASPAEEIMLAQILSQQVTDAMLKHKLPFAVEIHEDRLLVITDAVHPTEQSLSRMLHYGLWLARHLDSLA